MRRWFLPVAALLAVAHAGAAQSDTGALRLGLSLQQDTRVGHAPPPLVLPYATRDGAGPAGQPFDLSKELGHVVVLVFYPGDTSEVSAEEWRMIAARRADLDGPDVVVAGVSTDSLPAQVRFARDLDLWCKLLSDPGLAASRQFGAAEGPRAGRLVVVVGRTGDVRYVDPGFAALDPESYVHLAAAVRSATKESP